MIFLGYPDCYQYLHAVSNKRIIELLEDQLKLSAQREKSLLEQLHQQSIRIEELTASIRSLEEALLVKNGNIRSLADKNRGLSKLLPGKSEKITIVSRGSEAVVSEDVTVINLKERGNNNAKRKEFFDIETIIEDVYPNDPGFDLQKSRVIGYVDSILYECIPAKFIKRIFRQYNCLMGEKIYSAKAPRTPLLNSNYDGSFIAGMLQLRYIYSMPIERIVKYFAEHGFEINKSTAHGLIKKSAWMMERLDKVLKKTIQEDDYLSMDESYYTILTKEKNLHGKGVRKGYIWAALSNSKKLVQFFKLLPILRTTISLFLID